MARLFPYRPKITPRPDREARILDLGDEEADKIFDVLAAETTRRILYHLYEDPKPASEIAESVDTSLQNVQYHITKLSDAELIEVVDTWYSETGTEMNVYAPTDTAIVFFLGGDSQPVSSDSIKQMIGGVSVLAAGAVMLHAVTTAIFGDVGFYREAPANDELVLETQPEPAGGLDIFGVDVLGFLFEPAVLFFIGGIFVLLAMLAWRHRHRLQPQQSLNSG